jgi:hypothetical protein
MQAADVRVEQDFARGAHKMFFDVCAVRRRYCCSDLSSVCRRTLAMTLCAHTSPSGWVRAHWKKMRLMKKITVRGAQKPTGESMPRA